MMKGLRQQQLRGTPVANEVAIRRVSVEHRAQQRKTQEQQNHRRSRLTRLR